MMIPVLPVLRDPATIGDDRRRLHIRLKIQISEDARRIGQPGA